MIRGDTESVKPQAVLAQPEQRAVALCGSLYRRMGDGGAGTEDESRNGGYRQAGDQAVAADPFDRRIVHFKAAVFQIDGRPAIFGGSKAVERRAFEDRHERKVQVFKDQIAECTAPEELRGASYLHSSRRSLACDRWECLRVKGRTLKVAARPVVVDWAAVKLTLAIAEWLVLKVEIPWAGDAGSGFLPPFQ